MSTHNKLRRFTHAFLAVLCLGVSAAAAAQPAPSADAAAAAPATEDDEAAKNAIFNSDDWLHLRMGFDDWLSVQKFYDARQVRDLKTRMQKKIAAMNARDLRLFMMQMQAKLEILLSPEAADLRQWMGHFVSPSVVLTPEEMKNFDLLDMTAPQLDAALRTISSRRASRQSAGSAFQAARQTGVAQGSQANLQRQQANRDFRTSAKARSAQQAQQSHLAPPRLEPRRPRPRPQIIVGSAGGAAMVLPTP